MIRHSCSSVHPIPGCRSPTLFTSGLATISGNTVTVTGVCRGRDYAVSDDARAERTRRGFGYAPIEDQLHLPGAAQVRIFANDVFKQHSSADRAVEYLRQRQLDLPDCELITIACGPVRGRSAGVPVHHFQRSAHIRREIDFVNDQQIGAPNSRPWLWFERSVYRLPRSGLVLGALS